MPRYVALLRGINVGGHRVKMDRLRALFAELGYESISSFIASGNVVFSTAVEDPETLAGEIEGHLAGALGYGVETFIRTPEELAAVAAFEPPGHAEGRSLYVIFLKAPPDKSMRARFSEVDSDADRFTFVGREIYWSIAGKISESALFGSALERAIGGVSSTSRNVTSLRRLVAKLG